jgi:hypothetical protein
MHWCKAQYQLLWTSPQFHKKQNILYQIKAAQDILIYGAGYPKVYFWLFSITGSLYKLQPHHQPPTWRTRVPLLVWVTTFDLSGTWCHSSSITTASTALRIIWPHKPHHYVKVEIPSVGSHKIQILFVFKSYIILHFNALYMLCIHIYCDLNNIFVTMLLCKIQEKLSPVHNT